MPMTSATTLVRNCLVVASVGEPEPVGGPRASRVSWSISAIGDAPIIPSIRAGVYEHRSLVRIWQESEANQITQRQRTAVITKRQGNYKEHYDFRQSSIMSLIVRLSQECWLAWEPFSRKLLASVVCMLLRRRFRYWLALLSGSYSLLSTAWLGVFFRVQILSTDWLVNQWVADSPNDSLIELTQLIAGWLSSICTDHHSKVQSTELQLHGGAPASCSCCLPHSSVQH